MIESCNHTSDMCSNWDDSLAPNMLEADDPMGSENLALRGRDVGLGFHTVEYDPFTKSRLAPCN